VGDAELTYRDLLALIQKYRMYSRERPGMREERRFLEA
jgi:hypothetical protein